MGAPKTLIAVQTAMSEVENRGSKSTMLDQIAAALDVPAGGIVQPRSSHGIRARILAENAEALKIFAGMTDQDARQRGLAYLRWIAEQGNRN
jgi:hypothetical protein